MNSKLPNLDSLPNPSPSFGGYLGASPAMLAIRPLLEAAATTRDGEGGTGRGHLAQCLHNIGMPEGAPFITVAVEALSAETMVKTIFGASGSLIEAARGGTLFFSDVAELTPLCQDRLLLSLQDDSDSVRIIVAGGASLADSVRHGQFREDLLSKFVKVSLPPLRERDGDIALLANVFAREFAPSATIPRAVIAQWERYRWPGNLRELRIAVERYVTRADPRVPVDDEPANKVQAVDAARDFIGDILSLDLPLGEARRLIVEEFERRYVRRALERTSGNVSRAAVHSGVGRRFFQILKARARRVDAVGEREAPKV